MCQKCNKKLAIFTEEETEDYYYIVLLFELQSKHYSLTTGTSDHDGATKLTCSQEPPHKEA